MDYMVRKDQKEIKFVKRQVPEHPYCTNWPMSKENTKRFVEIADCEFRSSLFTMGKEFNNVCQRIKFAKWNYLKWKDLTLMKDPMTLSIYLQLLQDLKPKTILEFGTYEGGSALWMHDLMISLNLECKIHTFDINSEKVRLPNLESLIFHHLDNLHIIEYVKENYKLFSSLERPVLVIEDSHINVVELLQTIDSFIDTGDYLVVEDTLDPSKYREMESFLSGHDYLVDRYYCDFWGANYSWNVNSFLKKINTS